MYSRLLAVSVVACSAFACAGAPAGGLRPLLSGRGTPAASGAPERVFDINWWARADETPGLPFKPIESASPAINVKSGEVFVATADGKVHAFGKGGKALWDYEVGGAFEAGPTWLDGRLYVAGAAGTLLALDAAGGKRQWSYPAGEELVTRPVVSDGLVLVMSSADTLYAVDAVKGEWKWQYRREPPGQFTVRGASRPQVHAGKVYAGFADGFAVALDVKDGGLIWAKELAKGSQFIDVDGGPVADEAGRVYFGSYATGIFCLDGATGATVWSAEQPGASALALDASGSRLFVGGAAFLSAWDAQTGKRLWNLALGDRYVSGLTAVPGTLLAATGSGPLLFVDPANGRLRGTFDPGHGVSAAATPGLLGQALVLSNRGVVYDLALEASR